MTFSHKIVQLKARGLVLWFRSLSCVNSYLSWNLVQSSFSLQEDMFGASDGNSFFGERKRGSASHFEQRREQRCHTVTQKIGNMVTTYTQCS